MKIIAMYLPQYHSFPENDKWWGKGYTEWTAVKRGCPLYKGHRQPKVPKDKRYYDLVNDGVNTLKWQSELAEKYGLYGFAFYHYYFKGKHLMEKPMEILLSHPEIKMSYCIAWANETWTRAWYDRSEEILMKQEYGEKADWEAHFQYLLPFFKDERYIKNNGAPVMMIYRTFDIEKLGEMIDYLRSRAVEEGFTGIFFIGGKTAGKIEDREDIKDKIDGWYDFEPGYTLKHGLSPFQTFCYDLSVALRHGINIFKKKKLLERRIPIRWIYSSIEKRSIEANEYPGIISQWDNTPRRSYKGLVYTGASPEEFKRMMGVLKKKTAGRKNDYVFLNAWNEWGEGAMIEPTEEEGYRYLEGLK
ncbi:MAG: glycoside hydrolase family 99-like domain-containing protein [Lachnospiraceae bacterium]|nr:glycoside hydrolase family 99-like domain-containing protein [Lachnospiraceae bacterium]